MSGENRPDFIELCEFSELTDQQKATLVSKGVVLVESFLSLARANAGAMSALLACPVEELSRLCLEAEKLVGRQDALEVPHIPTFGLVPPSERTVPQDEDEPRKGQSPCFE
jgi:hypothetical protein